MAEEPTPDFTFDIAETPTPKWMAAVYAEILADGKRKPTVSLGAVTRAAAVEWLQAQHDRYVAGVGERSGMLKSMKLENRVELVGLSGG